MRANIRTALAAAVVLGLAGCGGGGGGGGGGGLPIGFVPAPAPAPPAAAELKLTVEIAGSVATPDGAGTYSVRPGQEVVVKASDSVAWAASGGGGTATLIQDVDTGATQWVSRFANSSKTDAASYKLEASASEGRTKQVNFAVQTGSYDNGDYMVFAANGSRQKLHIDFDAKTYDVTDAAGDKTSGTFSANGTGWVFSNSRVPGIPNNATFLTLKDSFAGGFPFAVPFSSPVTYKNAPFIATRAFVTTQAKLDGTYDRARVDYTSADRESAIAQIRISDGGTVMKQCVDQKIYRIENCPSGSVATTAVTADTEAGLWTLKDTSGAVVGKFGIAMVEGDKIYLSAGTSTALANQVMAIGVPAAATYADFNASGWATDGDINLSTVSPGLYSLTAPGGPGITKSLTLATIVDAPAGMRIAFDRADASQQYFAMRSSKLDVLIGTRGPSSPTRGYLHIGVIQ